MPQERLLQYRNTDRHRYGIVLVFGREGNNEGEMNDVIGRYDWGKSPNSGFWNRAYGFFARVSGVGSASALKRLGDDRDGSPIVFANCSPHLILNSVTDKDRYRVGKDHLVESHVCRVFELIDQTMPQRLKAAVVSVGSDFLLERVSVGHIRTQCNARGLPLIIVPYFGSRLTNEALDSQVAQSDKVLLARIVGEFLAIR